MIANSLWLKVSFSVMRYILRKNKNLETRVHRFLLLPCNFLLPNNGGRENIKVQGRYFGSCLWTVFNSMRTCINLASLFFSMFSKKCSSLTNLSDFSSSRPSSSSSSSNDWWRCLRWLLYACCRPFATLRVEYWIVLKIAVVISLIG
jgi:hypothetical protein